LILTFKDTERSEPLSIGVAGWWRLR